MDSNIKHHRIGFIIPMLVFVIAISAWSIRSEKNNRIEPYSENPHFWQYKGKPVLLLGGSGDDNLFNHLKVDGESLADHLDILVAAGGNYVRNTMSDRDDGNVYAFSKTGALYDLNSLNNEYWRRFEKFLKLAEKRNIIVQIELWDQWDLSRDNWLRHPFNPENNINYTAEKSGLSAVIPFQPAEQPTEHNFFHTVPDLDNNLIVLHFQEIFIDKILEISLTFPNVLYCINNESGEPPEWSVYWAERIHRRAEERGVRAQVTDMRRKEDITHATHRIIYENSEEFTFADVSQNTGNQIKDRKLQYSRLLEVRNYLNNNPRPINNVKIYNDNFGGVPKFIRNVFAGLAATRFHRPVPYWNGEGNRGMGLSEEAQQVIRSVRTFTNALNWFEMQPEPGLLSHDEGVYLMASPGIQYAIGFDGAGSVVLDASALNVNGELKWMNLNEGKWIDGGQIEPGKVLLDTPGEGYWLAMISKIKD